MFHWILFTVATFAPLVWEFARGGFVPLHPKNLFLVYLYLQIGGSWIIVHLLGGVIAFGSMFADLPPDQYRVAFSCAAAGVLAFHLGFYGSASLSRAFPPLPQLEPSSNRLRIALVLLFAIGYGAFFVLVASQGGFADFAQNRQTWRSEGVAGQGFLLFPATTGLALAALTCVVHAHRKSVPRWLAPLAVIASLGPATFIGFRALIILPAAQLVLVYGKIRGTLPRRATLVSATVGIVVFTAYGLYRQWSELVDETGTISEGLEAFASDRPELLFDVMLRSRGTDVVAAVMWHTDSSGGHPFFLPALVEAATIAVPKAIWPEKPTPLTVQFSQRFFGVDGGVSATTIGELFWHGGWFGVLLGMMLFGFTARTIHKLWADLPRDSFWSVILSFWYVYFVMSAESVQGYLNSAVLVGLTFAVLWLLIGSSRILPAR